MARTQTVRLLDDIDGSEDDVQTVMFTHKKVQYQIELSEKHRRQLDEALAPFIQHARKFRGNPVGGGKRPYETSVVRQWAIETGRIETDRVTGRLPQHLYDEYVKEHLTS